MTDISRKACEDRAAWLYMRSKLATDVTWSEAAKDQLRETAREILALRKAFEDAMAQ